MPGNKSFIMTINGVKNFHLDHHALRMLEPKCSVLYGAIEIGEETEQWHLQIYLTLKKEVGNKSFDWFRETFFTHREISRFQKKVKTMGEATEITNKEGGAWIQAAGGNRKANFEYIIRGINKDGTFKKWSWVFINKDIHDKIDISSDLELACDKLDNGWTFKQLMRNRDYLDVCAKHRSFLKEYEMACKETDPRQSQTWAIWLWGVTGCGKTGYGASRGSYHITATWPWMDGYSNQEWVIFDEMDKWEHPMSENQILMLTDRYQVRVQVKGSTINFNPKRILFTSTKPPWELFDDIFYMQLKRRLQCVAHKHRPDDIPLHILDSDIPYEVYKDIPWVLDHGHLGDGTSDQELPNSDEE